MIGLARELAHHVGMLWRLRQLRKRCWHHDPSTGTSWVSQMLINGGMGKKFWCRRCERTVFV
ncbi:hypothetical protein [Actinoplanes sp. URMC 104]|uniref:hypothetical protein n=1 Tax=Actinoplanes sp. URMC 104 TaxID=3423409 RepID=UPI003F194CC0